VESAAPAIVVERDRRICTGPRRGVISAFLFPALKVQTVKKTIHIGTTSIPLSSYAIQGTAILGTKDSGKTYAAKGIAEQLLDAGIPIIVFDPIARWRYLKLAGNDSKHPRGYKVVVAGGESGDLPLTPQSAPEIVRAAIRENIPLVLDFYDKRLSKADWRRIVQSCFRTLMYENKGVRHIFLEEAAEFAPQNIQDGATYAEVEKVVRMGGNVSLGITLLNQRSQEVNKAVLDLCDTLVLMRQRGSKAIESISKWMDKLAPDLTARIAKELPHMQAGEAWVMTAESDTPIRTRTAAIHSFHPNRRNPQLTAKAEKNRATDTADFISRLSQELGALLEEVSATDPARLKERVHELEKQLARKKPTDVSEAESRKAREAREAIEQIKKSLQITVKTLVTFIEHVQRDGDRIKQQAEKSLADATVVRPLKVDPFPQARVTATRPRAPSAVSEGNGSLSKGESAILAGCIMYPSGISREHLSVLTPYKRSSRDTYIQKLRERGYVVTSANMVQATNEGCSAMPDAEPLPTGEALRAYWMERLSKGEREILTYLVNAYPNNVKRDDLSEAGYTRSSRDTYLQRLRARSLITEPARGIVRATDNLFASPN